MSYRIRKSETPTQNFRRILEEQIQRAILDLSPESIARNDGIHRARKRFKKIRGLLRLMRPVIGKMYTSENRRFRDMGRRLSVYRDLDAMIATCDALQKHQRGGGGAAMFDSLRRELAAHREVLREDSPHFEKAVSEVRTQLKRILAKIAHWGCESEDLDMLAQGAKRTYQRGRKAMDLAYDNPTPEHFHQWRKRVKYSWYHMRLFADVWPPFIRAYRKAFYSLADILGDEHDLSVFGSHVLEDEAFIADQKDRKKMSKMITERQKKLRRDVRLFGERLYADKPKCFYRRMGRWLKAWK
jgi:CHAD domain-containing protein